jgi:hypothetical protein
MRRLWTKLAAIGFLAFLGLWTVGAVLGLALTYPPPAPATVFLGDETWPRSSSLPIANNLAQLGLALTPLPVVLDQQGIERIRVFEKSAHLALSTASFHDDEALIRSTLTSYQAIVFNERQSGVAPGRQLMLDVGVGPENFDALLDHLQHIGQLQSVSVQQRDRTNEFRRLYAQRQSLKKHQDALLKLRSTKNPSLDDTLKLEQRILDIEKDLQNVNVQFGDFLGKDSFYHIYVGVGEYQPGSQLDPAFRLPRRIAHAGAWALSWWAAMALAAGLAGGAYISVCTLWPKRSVN